MRVKMVRTIRLSHDGLSLKEAIRIADAILASGIPDDFAAGAGATPFRDIQRLREDLDTARQSAWDLRDLDEV